MVTTSTAFLGVTLGCARCHDHKFDPFSQADYYSMLSFFRGIDPYGLHKTGGGGRGTGQIEQPLATAEEVKRWAAEKQQRLQELERRIASLPESEKKALQGDLETLRQDRGPFRYALAAVSIEPKPTHILARATRIAAAEVQARFPTILDKAQPTSRKRAALADWIASPTNPLTSRVMVNRLWQYHFGRGIVATPDDFGRTGLPPSNRRIIELPRGAVHRRWLEHKAHAEADHDESGIPSDVQAKRGDERRRRIELAFLAAEPEAARRGSGARYHPCDQRRFESKAGWPKRLSAASARGSRDAGRGGEGLGRQRAG